MKTEVTTEWTSGMNFISDIDDHKIVVDAKAEFGGEDKGPTPKKLLLSGLAGCTGMDVISVLKKMRQKYTFFNIKIEAEMTEEHPKYYNAFHITYLFKKADGLDEAKVKRAVELSQDRYCGVSYMFKQFASLDYSIEYVD